MKSLKIHPPECWMVTINGVKFKGPYFGASGRREAEGVAEYFQGHSSSYGGHRRGGFLKHRDRGQHVEVKRDRDAEERWRFRTDEANRGNPQRTYVEHEAGIF